MKSSSFSGSLVFLGWLLALAIPNHGALGQTNIVLNNSFELGHADWDFTSRLGVEINKPAADGTNYLKVYDTVFQDLATVPGRDYYLQFAYQATMPQVYWGGQLIETTNLPSSGGRWLRACGFCKATNAITRLLFLDQSANDLYGTPLDDILVGWAQEPVTILAHPQGQSVIEGGTANFVVRAMGGPPLFYQWLFNGNPIGWGTDRVLSLDNVGSSQAGNYSVIVSNLYSSWTSSNVVLQVEQLPSAPLIMHQPASQRLSAGYGYAMTVIALGQAPLEYQWRFNGVDRPGATNSSILFESVGDADAGTYAVLVRNQHGSVMSLPATLTVTQAVGGGYVSMENRLANAPVFDTDGTTRLTGSNCIAQLYVGVSRDMLRPVGQPRWFFPAGIPTFAGFLYTPLSYVAPDVAPGEKAFVQLRVWERLRGSCYEEARARGGKFGMSDIFEETATSPPQIPNGPMRSFSLKTGLPLFTTGKLVPGGKLPDGSRQWTLIGEPGFRYLVEKRQPPHDWEPWLILTNTAGTVTFSDPEDPNRPINFYRSRILD